MKTGEIVLLLARIVALEKRVAKLEALLKRGAR